MINKNKCTVCNMGYLKSAIFLKNFPITGIFNRSRLSKNKNFKLDLGVCDNCQHLQLRSLVSKNILYDTKYYNRTGKSHLSEQAYEFFKKFIFKNKKGNNLGNLLEIGCNDITMLKKFSKFSKKSIGIDPIWRGKKISFGKVKVLGKFIEDVDFKNDLDFIPNTIISTHNLEHIENPFNVFNKLSQSIAQNGMIFIEVPDATTMIKNLRYDQIFHQHYHYFTLNSLKNLASRAGLKIVDHDLNEKFWGGSLMVAMKKTEQPNTKIIKSKSLKKKIRNNFNKFKNKYSLIRKKIKKSKNLIAYGAGQMTPTFAYHLNSKFREIQYILDDDKSKNGTYYPGLEPKILYAKNKKLDDKAPYLITALDGVKPIRNKLMKKKINKIISI